MEDKSGLIEEILQRELKMFTSVNARGGPAPCQSHPEGFVLHRRAQFSVWSTDTLASCSGAEPISSIEKTLLSGSICAIQASDPSRATATPEVELPPVPRRRATTRTPSTDEKSR